MPKGWNGIIGHDKNGAGRRLSCLYFNIQILWSTTGVRKQDLQFPDGDLLDQLDTCELGILLKKFQEGKIASASPAEFRPIFERFCEQYNAHPSHSMGKFPFEVHTGIYQMDGRQSSRRCVGGASVKSGVPNQLGVNGVGRVEFGIYAAHWLRIRAMAVPHKESARGAMTWDKSSERMENLRRSIRPILTDMPLQRVLAEDFPRDCADLPISGGWGYTQQDAITFIRGQFPRPSAPDFVALEYHIAQKIIYEELIIFRLSDSRFSGIDMNLKSQRMLADGERRYDCLDFIISCWSDFHWNSLKMEWEDNDAGERPGFDREAHIARRQSARIEYERQFWFDITDVFER